MEKTLPQREVSTNMLEKNMKEEMEGVNKTPQGQLPLEMAQETLSKP